MVSDGIPLRSGVRLGVVEGWGWRLCPHPNSRCLPQASLPCLTCRTPGLALSLDPK